MSKRTDQDLLEDIQEAIGRIQTYIAGASYEFFLEDTKTQDAVVRNLEVIGEAVRNLSVEIRETHSDIPWKGMAGIRDRLIHQYFGINFDIIWEVITTDLPELTTPLSKLKRESKGS